MSSDDQKRCMNRHCKRFLLPIYSTGDTCIACDMELDYVHDLIDEPEFPSSFDDSLIDDPTFPTWISAGVSQPMSYRPVTTDVFTCSPDVEGCPIIKAPEVRIPLDMFNRWMFLARQISTEWMAYLKGDEEQRIITEMYFPKQKVTRAHVEAEDGQIQPGTIGAVHSHVAMEAFWSAEDKAHMNHNIEIVLNRKGDILSSVRVKLECGQWSRTKGKVILTQCDSEFDLVSELQEKLSEERVVTEFLTDGGKK